MKRRRDRAKSNHFGAPWATSVWVITSLSGLMLAGVAVGSVIGLANREIWAAVLVPVLLVSILATTALFCVRGYSIEGRTLNIKRLCWTTRLSLEGLRSVETDEDAMRGSMRTCGNGGLFAYTGWFRNKKIGSFRAWVTDPRRSVVLAFDDRKWVVSPDEPRGFVAALDLHGAQRKAGA